MQEPNPPVSQDCFKNTVASSRYHSPALLCKGSAAASTPAQSKGCPATPLPRAAPSVRPQRSPHRGCSPGPGRPLTPQPPVGMPSGAPAPAVGPRQPPHPRLPLWPLRRRTLLPSPSANHTAGRPGPRCSPLPRAGRPRRGPPRPAPLPALLPSRLRSPRSPSGGITQRPRPRSCPRRPPRSGSPRPARCRHRRHPPCPAREAAAGQRSVPAAPAALHGCARPLHGKNGSQRARATRSPSAPARHRPTPREGARAGSPHARTHRPPGTYHRARSEG